MGYFSIYLFFCFFILFLYFCPSLIIWIVMHTDFVLYKLKKYTYIFCFYH